MIEHHKPPEDPIRWLQDLDIDPNTWSAGAGAHFPMHSHTRTKRLFVRQGSISFNGDWLHAPAAIRIPAGLEHSADVGEHGVECVEGFEH
jgi:hypothetical protein